MNCRKTLNNIYHLTSNLLPHYRAKVEYSTIIIIIIIIPRTIFMVLSS